MKLNWILLLLIFSGSIWLSRCMFPDLVIDRELISQAQDEVGVTVLLEDGRTCMGLMTQELHEMECK